MARGAGGVGAAAATGADRARRAGGPDGAAALEAAANRGFLDFARARGNVLLEHVGHAVELADFAYRDDPFAWHARDARRRVSPIEARRHREGPSNRADLAAAKRLLATRFVVGLTSRFEESLRRFAHVFAGRELPASVLERPEASSHTVHADDPRFVKLDALSAATRKELHRAVALDLKLYAFAEQLFDSRVPSSEAWPPPPARG